MDVAAFQSCFDLFFPEHEREVPSPVLEHAFTRSYFDPCFGVNGMTSVKVQHMLRLGCLCLPQHEAYLEIGTFQGKTLISALQAQNPFKVYACDNFSEFSEDAAQSHEILRANLQAFGVLDRVKFYQDDFRKVMNKEMIPEPVGFYFFDGPHAAKDQEDAIVFGEPVLADSAVVVIDDWCRPEVQIGTQRGIAASANIWEPLYMLPVRPPEQRPVASCGDYTLWWNGIAVYRFERRRV